MLIRMARPMRRKGSTLSQFRQRIPKDVLSKARGTTLALPIGPDVSHIVVSDKAVEVTASLRTRDPQEAKLRQSEILAYLEGVWQSLRDGPQSLTHKQVVALAGEVYRETVARYEADPGPEDVWQHLVRIHTSVAAAGQEAQEKWFGATVDQTLAARNLVVDRLTREKLVGEVSKALSYASDRLLRNAEGDYSPDAVVQRFPMLEAPRAEPAKAASVSSGHSKEAVSLRQMAEKKLAMNAKSYSTTEATETALRLFESLYGDRAMESITRREVANWILLLQQKPTKPQKQHKGLDLRELVEAYANRLEVERLSGKTINGHVGHLNSIWTFARKRGLVDRSLDNPFSEQRVEERAPAPTEGFSSAQLQAIFDLPVFTRGERPAGGKGQASYWVPLLLLTYGNRPEELCQLLVSDVSWDDEEQYWGLTITDEGEHPEKGSRNIKAGGNPLVRRTLPITQRLIDLGFLSYVEAMKKRGEPALFPDLKPNGQRGYLHTKFAEWWGAYIREHGAIPESGNKPLRGFRNAWTTAAARGGITEEEREWIQGHYVSKGKTSNRRYGIRDYGKRLDSLQYRGLDLSKVLPWDYKPQ